MRRAVCQAQRALIRASGLRLLLRLAHWRLHLRLRPQLRGTTTRVLIIFILHSIFIQDIQGTSSAARNTRSKRLPQGGQVGSPSFLPPGNNGWRTPATTATRVDFNASNTSTSSLFGNMDLNASGGSIGAVMILLISFFFLSFAEKTDTWTWTNPKQIGPFGCCPV